MTATKQKDPMPSASLLIREREALSEEILRARSMNYWLEKINPADIEKLWTRLQDCARDAQPRILSEIWASGTILNRDFRAGVTASTTGDGFVLVFTVKDMSK